MQDTEILKAALIGFQHQHAEVTEKIAALRSQIGGAGVPREVLSHETAEGPTPKKRTMSAAARKRIALAQKKRWAAYKAENGTPMAAKTTPKAKKRTLSAAGRARIIAATKKRWAAFHKSQ